MEGDLRPAGKGTAAYVCENTATPSCQTIAVAALAAMTGIDPFPALPASVKQTAMALPDKGRLASTHHCKRHHREPRSVLELLPQ